MLKEEGIVHLGLERWRKLPPKIRVTNPNRFWLRDNDDIRILVTSVDHILHPTGNESLCSPINYSLLSCSLSLSIHIALSLSLHFPPCPRSLSDTLSLSLSLCYSLRLLYLLCWQIWVFENVESTYKCPAAESGLIPPSFHSSCPGGWGTVHTPKDVFTLYHSELWRDHGVGKASSDVYTQCKKILCNT